MTSPRDAGRVVIVGGGLAGYSAATQLRTLGHAGSITIVDPEPLPYDRPPLSKKLFEPDFSIDSLAFADEEKLAASAIDTRFGLAAASLDATAKTVTLDDGSTLTADTLLLATGGRARTLQVPGSDLPGVHVLRTFADAKAVSGAAKSGARAVVIGAGLIGAELASSLLHAGVTVTLIDPVAVPLVPAVGEVIADRLHSMHVEQGIETILGVTAAIHQVGESLEVQVDAGPRVTADLVVVGVGIVPNVELADVAGIDVDNGILVSPRYETSAPDIYAAGDVARLRDDEGTLHRREEHWEAAQLSGQHSAYAMLGLDIPSRGAAWFWTDRHGIHLEATGRLTGPGEVVVRHTDEHPAVFLIDDGVLVGAAAIDDNNTVRAARRLIDQRIPVSAADLADRSVALRSLLRAAR